MPLPEINLPAGFIVSLVSMVRGAVWYSPILFGNAWLRLIGMSEEELEKAKVKGMDKSCVLAFICSIINELRTSQYYCVYACNLFTSRSTCLDWIYLPSSTAQRFVGRQTCKTLPY